MPIYTYKCEACDRTFEQKQRMLDEPLTKCVLCNESGVRRVINSVGILFKGNGFYVTDNRGKNGALAPNKSGSEESTATKDKPAESENKSSESKKQESEPKPTVKEKSSTSA